MAQTCPCCGHKTLPERGAYDLCPVCWWEDDDAPDDAVSLDGPNGKTLAEGQRLYQRYATSDLTGLNKVRAPSADEPRNSGWRPLPTGADDTATLLRDYGRLLEVLTEQARDTARARRSKANIGHFAGLRHAFVLLVSQADSFGIPRTEVGVDPDFIAERDLLLDPPRGFFAG